MYSFLVAVAFLTIVPVRFRKLPPPEMVARSRFWFPVVGLLLGAILGAMTALVGMFASPLLGSFLILAIWVAITGALHIDGLADLGDGLFAGPTPGDRLRIMKDPHVGTFGVVGVALLLLGKFAALADLLARLPNRAALPVGAAVMASRCLALSVAAHGRYPRSQGTGKVLIEATTSGEGVFHACLALLIFYALTPGGEIIPALAIAGPGLVMAAALKSLCERRLGGITGDCLGATIELTELVFLLAAACVLPTTG